MTTGGAGMARFSGAGMTRFSGVTTATGFFTSETGDSFALPMSGRTRPETETCCRDAVDDAVEVFGDAADADDPDTPEEEAGFGNQIPFLMSTNLLLIEATATFST